MSLITWSPASTYPMSAVAPWRGVVDSPLDGLLGDPGSNRTWRLTATPIDPSTGTETTVRVATRGYWDWKPGASTSNQWAEGLVSPYSYRLDVLPGGRAASGAIPVLGDWVIANPNGDYDTLLDYSWAGAEVTISLGDASEEAMIAQENGTGDGVERFAPVLIGKVNSITANAGEIRLRARWALDPLELTQFQTSVYKGWGGSLRAPLRVVYPSPQTPVPGDQWTARVRVLVDSGTGRLFGDQASPSSGAGWLIRINASQQVEAELKDGTNTTTLTSSALADGWHEIALEVDQLTDEDATLYVGETIEDTAALTSWSAVPSGNPAVGEAVGTGDGLDAGEIAQAEIWQGLRGAGTGVVYDGTEAGLIFLDNFSERSGVVSGQTAKWTSDAVSFDGVDDEEEITLASQLFQPDGSSTIEILQADAASGSEFLYSEGDSTGTAFAGIFHGVAGTDRLSFRVVDDSGGQLTKFWDNVFDGAARHLTLVYDAGNVTLYVDGRAQSTQSFTVADTVTLDLLHLGAQVLSSSQFFWPGRVYGCRLWSRALTSSEIETLTWNPSVDGVDQTGLEVNLLHDEGTGNPVDTANGNTVTLTGATWVSTAGDVQAGTWSSTFEGEEDVRGKSKPRAVGGVLRGVELTLVDPIHLIWQATGGSMESFEVVRDGASAQTNLGDTTDLISASPAPASGEYRTDISRGLIRTGSEPARNLTCEIKGETLDGTYTADRWTIIQELAEEAGITDVDATSITEAQAADVAGSCGVFAPTGDRRSVGDVLRMLAAPDGWVTGDRIGRLSVSVLPDPSAVAADHVIDTLDLKDGASGLEIEQVLDPAWRIVIAWGRNYSPQSLSDLGGTAIGLGLYNLTQAWREELDENASILTNFPEATDERFETAITTRSGALAMLARLRTLFGSLRKIARLDLPEGLFQYSPGDGFTVSLERYDLTSNTRAVCVGFDETDKQTSARIWL